LNEWPSLTSSRRAYNDLLYNLRICSLAITNSKVIRNIRPDQPGAKRFREHERYNGRRRANYRDRRDLLMQQKTMRTYSRSKCAPHENIRLAAPAVVCPPRRGAPGH